MEIKTEAIVLQAIDYKDNDKLLTLFSPSLGRITAGIRGVKKPTAKLAFSAQPFCFAEYILAEKGAGIRLQTLTCTRVFSLCVMTSFVFMPRALWRKSA